MVRSPISPSPGAATGASSISKSPASGAPAGRLAKRMRRLVAGMTVLPRLHGGWRGVFENQA